MVHYYCPFLQCQKISESVHLIDFVQTSVVCTLLTIIFTDASVLEESKQKMTDSNQVRIVPEPGTGKHKCRAGQAAVQVVQVGRL